MGNARRAAFLLALLGGGLALASLDTPKRRTIQIPGGIDQVPANFFIGAWVSPPTSTTDPEVWRRFGRTGIDVALRPLEDPNDRARNVSTLALLDSLDVSLVPRDDAIHPDELRRPGWQQRVRDVVAAYRGHRSLFAYFIVDEPKPAVMDSIATLTREFAAADPAHPAYVNLLPTYEHDDGAAQERWRANAIRLIRDGRIGLWSWSAYSQRRWGEDASFLLTQRNAMLVGRATGTRPIAILQFTGFLTLDPLPKAQLDYLAAESIAHGAGAIAWFTYWTPNSSGPEGPWRGGAVDYDGMPSPRADTLAAVNSRARRLAAAFPGPVARVAHFGAPMPRGEWVPSDRIPGLRTAVGGPITIASDYGSQWLVVSRDRARARTITLRLAPGTILLDAYDPETTNRRRIAADMVTLELAPGGSAVLRWRGLQPR